MQATAAVLRHESLFGKLILAVPRLTTDAAGNAASIQWHGLRGMASLVLSPEAVGPELGQQPVAGQAYFLMPGTRVALHPLVVYQEDGQERERIAFLNRTTTRRRGEGDAQIEEVRRCEYLDYTSGDQLRAIDARRELTELLARLRGRPVTDSDMNRVLAVSRAEPYEEDPGPVLAGGSVIGDFELEGELGRGGMGVVYKVRQRSLNRHVALKVLPPALAADPVARARFHREVAALARCDHPNLVKILTSGSDGDRHYYAMELVEGRNLADLIDTLARWQRGRVTLRAGLLPRAVSTTIRFQRRQTATGSSAAPESAPGHTGTTEEAVASPANSGPALHHRLAELCADVGDALAHLHERGVLHRDIKPGNLMLTADGQRVVLMDLGLALIEGEGRDRLTRTRQFVGTLRYASPEQAVAVNRMDARSDVYSLGATLWELLTLRPLFDADDKVSDVELIRRIQFDVPGRIRKHRPEVSADLEAIVLKCLEKDPRRRYATARELADDLDRWKRGEPVTARRQTPWYRLTRFVGRHRRAVSAGVFALLLLMTGYVGLADAGLAVPGGEPIRRQLDRYDASLLRPVPGDERVRQTAAGLRTSLVRKLLQASSKQHPGWWDGMIRPAGAPEYDAWTQGQTTAALLSSPETDAAERRLLAESLLQLFEPPDQRLRPFKDGYGWILFQYKSPDKQYPSAIGAAWVLPALAKVLARPSELDPQLETALRERLGRLQNTLEYYSIADGSKPTGAWKMFRDQLPPDELRANIYVTTTMFYGLLELHRAGLPWQGSVEKRDRLLRATAGWLTRQFDGRGWPCPGVNREADVNDGLTLWLFALFLRAEAEAGIPLPEDIAARIPVHLAQCGNRSLEYPNTAALFSVPFKYRDSGKEKDREYREETRVVRILWYPWSVEATSRWLARCRTGAPADEIVRTRRVLGHLVLDLGPPTDEKIEDGATYVAAETLLGLSAVELP